MPTYRYGIAYLPQDIVEHHLAAGDLVLILEDWSPLFAGYYIYYPSRRQNLPAFKVIVDALRRRKSQEEPQDQLKNSVRAERFVKPK